MACEVRPLGVNCNIRCHYCYQNAQRDAGNLTHGYDLSAIKKAVEAEGTDFILFGGEPLLIRETDLEELWRWGFEKFGRNGIQTNGTLITGKHMELFLKYNVHVGISIDGPSDCNDFRWSTNLEKTRQNTDRTMGAIRRLCEAGIIPSLIITLHRGNALPSKLPRMKEWLSELATLGIKSVRLHTLEIENQSAKENLALTEDQNLDAMLFFLRHQDGELSSIRFNEFQDMRSLLLGKDNRTSCVWNACDPYTTRAVRGIEGNGQRSNCGRVNKEGIDFVKAESPGYERYIALYHTPQEFGGCQGCKFFLVCKGQCPGTAIDGDWRNRSESCDLWKRLYQVIEDRIVSEGRVPLSLDPQRRAIETELLTAWESAQNPTIEGIRRQLSNFNQTD
jgi:uncharacterized protein